MINPWVILAVLVAWMGTLGYAYHAGGEHREDALKAQHEEEMVAIIGQHNANTVVDMQAAAEAAEVRTITRIEYRDRVKEITRLIHEDPTDCPLPDNYRVRINESIDAANNKISAKPGAVPAPAEAGDRDR